MTTNTNIDYIRKIGSNIHSMSFIIGAGFSKNISDKYLTWGELLQDMRLSLCSGIAGLAILKRLVNGCVGIR